MKRITAFLLATVMMLTLTACGQEPTDKPPVTSPNSVTDPTTPTDPGKLSPIYKIDSYSGSAEDVIANRDTVVATFGDKELTNATLQLYYWLDVYDFISNNDFSAYGMSLSKPLDQQKCGDTGTWQHYFLAGALSSWNYHQALAMMAEKENVPLNAYYQKLLDNMEEELTQSALDGGFNSIDEMIQADAGPGCTIEDYRQYRQVLYAAQNFCYSKVNAMSFTEQQVNEYFTENEAALAFSGITKNLGNCHRVRHILLKIKPEATDKDWDQLQLDAQALLDQWKSGEATEESFAALAVEKSEDPGSVNYGGLYQGLTEQTSFLQPFKDWYLDESRQVGDYGLVKTTAGYHIMYYSGEEPIWYAYCREMMTSDAVAEIENAALDQFAAVIHYDKILLGEVSLEEEK